jgi:hypothetical protein
MIPPEIRALEQIGFVLVVPAGRTRDHRTHVLVIVNGEGCTQIDVRDPIWVRRIDRLLGTGGWLTRRIKDLLSQGRIATLPPPKAAALRRPLERMRAEIELLERTTLKPWVDEECEAGL